MFSRFLVAQRAAHHNQNLSVLPVTMTRRRCFTSSSSDSSSASSSASTLTTTSLLLAWYSKRLETHPLTTKGVTSGLISATGDVICQYLTSPDEPWDLTRTAHFLFMGTFWVAPITHVWYDALSTRIIPGARSRTKVFQRLMLDQFGMAPLFVPSFMAGLWILEGRDKIWEPLLEVAPEVIQANWALWIPAQVVNFSLIPLNYQVLFSNVVALVWTVYFSWANANSSTSPSSASPPGADLIAADSAQ